ncbi:SRPBCC family protein [Bacteroidota bacterium]
MKFLKILLIIIASLVVLSLIITALLPSEADVERSVEINAPAKVTFELVNSLKNREKWSPWFAMDPNGEYKYSGNESGKGCIQSWNSDNQNVGKGQMEIIESVQYKSIKTKLTFFGQDFGKGSWTFDEKDGVTLVTWSLHYELSFFMRWLGFGMDAMMGKTFENGLNKIKEIAESTA